VKKKIKLLSLDVDGVLTDCGVYVSEKGDIMKKFNVRDGVGIRQLIKSGIPVAFISAGKVQKMLNARAKMLGVKLVYAGDEEKLEVMKRWCKKLKIGLKDVAHIADDLNDINLLSAVGVSVCPNDAVDKVKSCVEIILDEKGGAGCVREFIDRYVL
jgi:3-deoxy-D-manno-octulosonate 8-phosphate phosphatase (KDO 8-P phosphatase)